MNENAIAQQLIDQLRFYSYGARGMLSPENQIAWARQYGNPRALQSLQQGARQVAQRELGTLGRMGNNIITPAMGFGAAALMSAYNNVKKDARIADEQERLLKEAGLNQTAFDTLYPTLDTKLRGWLGNRFPEYYQDYMRRNY